MGEKLDVGCTVHWDYRPVSRTVNLEIDDKAKIELTRKETVRLIKMLVRGLFTVSFMK